MIKASFRLILAALAATATLVGCTKEITPPSFENDKVAPAAEGTRVIAVSFAPQTKTQLDTLQPKFIEDDEILVCTVPTDKVDPEMDTCTVTFDDEGQPTITTKLTGELKAYYPAKAAKLDKSNHLIRFTISNSQTGEFADANLCRAEIGENDEKATFINDYPLFIIYPPTGTKVLNIYSLRDIENGAQRTGTSAAINTDGKSDGEKLQIQIGDGSSDVQSPCYVVLNHMGNLKLSNLSFEAKTSQTGGSIKGIPTSKIADAAGAAVGTEDYDKYNAVKSGTAYTIDDTNWHGYVEFAGHKWATMNIGANAPEEYGDYFAWGDTVGHSLKSNWKDNYNSELGCYENVFKDDYAFTWSNCPFTNGVYSEDSKKVFTKYVPEDKATEYGYGDYSDSKTVLDLCDDAAYVKWGGAWRMPTKKEFDDFLLQTDEYNDCVNNGCFYFNSLIKIPVSGRICGGTGLLDPTEALEVYLWSSSLWASNPNTPVWATDLSLNADTPDFSVWCRERYAGAPIRAIIDDGYIPAPAEE